MTTWIRITFGGLLVLGLAACGDDFNEEPLAGEETETAEAPSEVEVDEPLTGELEQTEEAEPAEQAQQADEIDPAELDSDLTEVEEDEDVLSSRTFPAAETLGLSWLGSEQIRRGQPYEYTIRVTNLSDAPVQSVVVYQVLPEGFEILSSEPRHETARAATDAAADENARSARWRVDRLPPEESRSFQVTGVAHRAGDLRPCLYADYQPSLCPTLQVVEPELTMTMRYLDGEGSPRREFYACEEVLVEYSLENTGSGTTRSVTIRQPLPRGFSTAEGEDRVMLEVPGIEAGETFTTDPVALRIENSGRYTTSATASTEGADGAEARTESIPLVIMRPQIALRVDGPGEEYVGREIAYQVEVRNTSEYPARNARVRIPLLEEGQRVSLSTQQVERDGDVLEVGRLEAGASRSFTVRMEPTERGELSARFVAEAYCAPEVERTVTTNIEGVAAAQLELVDDADPVAVGELVTYEVSVLNEGSAADLDVRLSGQVPENMEFVTGEGVSMVRRDGDRIVFSPVAELPPGEEASWQVRFRPTEPGRTRFQVEMTSDATRRPVRDSEPTRIVAESGENNP